MCKELLKVHNLSEDQYDCAVVASGMAAIAITITNILKGIKNSTILISNELYEETPDIAISLSENIMRVDIFDNEKCK